MFPFQQSPTAMVPRLQGLESRLWVIVNDTGNRTATSTTAVIQSVCRTNLDTLGA